jgi:hypothetical protein
MKAGITGHQELGGDANVNWLAAAMERLIARERVTLGLSCLARGADQLFACTLERLGLPFWAILPCAGYESTFGNATDAARFRHLLAHASRRLTLPFATPSESAYLAAGHRLVDEAKIIFAIWDGKPAAGQGGTGDIAAYAIGQGKRLLHLDPFARRITVR